MNDPLKWAEAFNAVPDIYKWAVLVLVAAFIVALMFKWWPKRGEK